MFSSISLTWQRLLVFPSMSDLVIALWSTSVALNIYEILCNHSISSTSVFCEGHCFKGAGIEYFATKLSYSLKRGMNGPAQGFSWSPFRYFC